MNTNTIRKAIAAVTFTAALVGCGTVSDGSTAVKTNNYDAPRGQIGHTYAVSTINVQEHILPDDKRCV